jgi:hypothetical protein
MVRPSGRHYPQVALPGSEHDPMFLTLRYTADAHYASNLERLFKSLNREDRHLSSAMISVS